MAIKKPHIQKQILAEKRNKLKARKPKGIPTKGKLRLKKPKPGMTRKDI